MHQSVNYLLTKHKNHKYSVSISILINTMTKVHGIVSKQKFLVSLTPTGVERFSKMRPPISIVEGVNTQHTSLLITDVLILCLHYAYITIGSSQHGLSQFILLYKHVLSQTELYHSSPHNLGESARLARLNHQCKQN